MTFRKVKEDQNLASKIFHLQGMNFCTKPLKFMLIKKPLKSSRFYQSARRIALINRHSTNQKSKLNKN